jgi:hypothetical protein
MQTQPGFNTPSVPLDPMTSSNVTSPAMVSTTR